MCMYIMYVTYSLFKYISKHIYDCKFVLHRVYIIISYNIMNLSLETRLFVTGIYIFNNNYNSAKVIIIQSPCMYIL